MSSRGPWYVPKDIHVPWSSSQSISVCLMMRYYLQPHELDTLDLVRFHHFGKIRMKTDCILRVFFASVYNDATIRSSSREFAFLLLISLSIRNSFQFRLL